MIYFLQRILTICLCCFLGIIYTEDVVVNNLGPNPEFFQEHTIEIEHSVGGNDIFQLRSSFTVQVKVDGKNIAIAPEKNGISTEEIRSFKGLLSENKLYKIRIHSKLGNYSSPYVSSSIPACELQKSGFKEDITLHLDTTNSYIVGISYASPVIALSRPCDPEKIKSPQLFHSRVKIADKAESQTVPLQALGPRPPIMAQAKLDEDAKEAGKAGAGNQQTSFLRRYWYLVVPMCIFMLLPEGGGKADKKGGPIGPAPPPKK